MNRAPAGDMMKHPTALFGYRNVGSHCTNLAATLVVHTATVQTHHGASYGDDTSKVLLA